MTWRKYVRRLLTVALTELGRQLLLGMAIVIGLIGGIAIPPIRVLAIGLIVAVVITLAVDLVNRWWEYRREFYSVRVAELTLGLRDGGHQVMYKQSALIRCKVENQRQMRFIYRWIGTGQIMVKNVDKAGPGFALDVKPESRTRGTVTVVFDRPLRKWRSKRVDYRVAIEEPGDPGNDQRRMRYTTTHMSSLLSRLTLRILWDATVPINEAELCVLEYRSPWDEERELAELDDFKGTIRHNLDGSAEWSWSIRPIPPNRTYTAWYPFR